MYSYHYLLNFTTAVLEKMGFGARDALRSAEVFLAAELRGISTHGVIRLGDYYKLWDAGRLNPHPDIRIVYETPGTAAIDGDNTIGMLPSFRAMEVAMDKARNVGTGWVSVRNSCNFGIAGYYAMMAAREDMIGITLTNASPLVAPTFSSKAMLGTNPIAVAIPALNQPMFVADFATTPITRGKFTVASKKGEKIGFGFAQTRDGVPSDDPDVLEQGGSMLPLGGDREHGSHKGYCLGALVDIFSAVLSGANYGPFVPPMVSFLPVLQQSVGSGLGHFFGAMRVDAFMPAQEFKERMDHWIQTMREAPPAAGCEQVLIPGDVERASEGRIMREGIYLIPQVAKELQEIAQRFSLDFEEK